MADEAHLAAAAILAVGASFAATPLAIAVASKTNFHDHPVGYKGHAAPTPYLGGLAVLCGFLVGALTIGAELDRLGPIVGGAAVLWVVGTLDDRFALRPSIRLGVEAALAVGLWALGLGWSVFDADVLNLAVSAIWIVGLVNAFNLVDNIDGAAATLAAVTCVSVGALALTEGDLALAAVVIALGGACVGFLPYNLASPSRIFLGDGGSLPIGFVVAASIMALPIADELGVEHLFAALLLAGLPVLDTSLVSISRRRAGVSLLTGGRDHLTHRLASRLGTPRAVSLAIGTAQACLGAVAIGVVQLGRGSVLMAWSIWFVVATAAIVLLETHSWAPMRDGAPVVREARPGPRRTAGPDGTTAAEAILIAFIATACGLSPFLYGFYDVSVWGPIALGLLAGLLGLLIARPAAPQRRALIGAAALVALWLWALGSTAWAESADQAMTEANRWLLYAALFGVLVLLVRNDRLARIVVGAGAAAIGAFAAYLLGRMLVGSADELFLSGRLNEPLGYVNGEAGYLLLGVWPLIALAEHARRPIVGAAGVAGVSALLSLALLGQTRAVLPAFIVALVVLLAVVPGRKRRAWLFAAAACGVAVAIGPVLAVYDSAQGGLPDEGVLRKAAVAIAIGGLLAGFLWTALTRLDAWLSTRITSGQAQIVSWGPLAVAAMVALAVAITVVEDPVDRVADEYRSFAQLEKDTSRSTRFTTGAGNRYDYWRVAWDQFADHPLHGVGAGNYDRTYFLERRTSEDIRQPHSIELQALSELGLVGGAALALFLGAVLSGFARRARAARFSSEDRFMAVAAGGAFLVWLVHTSVDWLHLIPGVTGLALASAAVLVAPWPGTATEGAGVVRRDIVLALAVLIMLGAVLVGRSALAEKYRSDAQDLIRVAPAGAIAKANDSLALDDEALDTYYAKAAAYARLDDYRRARGTLLEATRREPHDFVTWGLLGDLAMRRGALADARRAYREAARLNPLHRGLAALAKDPTTALRK